MASTSPRPPPKEGFNFTFDPKLHSLFNRSMRAFLSNIPVYRLIAIGALVFIRTPLTVHPEQEDRILLIQRASHDIFPLLWEIPGGGCDHSDETILHGLARELWEESGLRMKSVVREVGQGDSFYGKDDYLIVKFSFEVEVFHDDPQHMFPQVTLDPNEHVRFLWATEEECRRGKVVVVHGCGDRDGEVVDIPFTVQQQKEDILRGFEQRREARMGEDANSRNGHKIITKYRDGDRRKRAESF